MAVQILETEIAIIGGGFGGVAAALAAAEAGRHVILTEPTDWIGGQVTSQAVSALDEHHYIETFGGTRAYYRFREGVRDWYRARYPAVNLPQGGSSLDEETSEPYLNPGSGWVSRLCFEPRVGLEVLEGMLEPHVQAGRLRILLLYTPAAAEVRAGRIQSVMLVGPQGARVTLRAEMFLDASELGDLLPLAGVPYISGAEAVEDTGEAHASTVGPQPARVQSFTWCFMVEHRPGEKHIIHKPQGYEYQRQFQPFSLVLTQRGGGVRRHFMFEGELPFWEYRRVFHAGLLAPGSFADPTQPARDIALINWDSNDYYKENRIDRTPAQQARILQEARRLSLSFLYWLQTEVPHDQGKGRGYPGLRLVPEATGTPDGLAKAPYIRESRRVLGFRRVLEQDITAPVGGAQAGRGARAVHFTDSVGVGWYPVDLHRCAGDPPEGRETRVEFESSQPFQIPLGAMISPALDNLLAAAKNISTTHITNGAYRVHPVEWAIGEAAGTLAAACLADKVRPRMVWESPERLRAFQKSLLARGVPLVWMVDTGLDDPDFNTIQSCLLNGACSPGMPENSARDGLVGIMPARSPRRERLEVLPDQLLSRPEGAWLVERLPRARDNARLAALARAWQDGPLGPFTGQDWLAACAAMNLPAPAGLDYPTLRQVCQALAHFV